MFSLQQYQNFIKEIIKGQDKAVNEISTVIYKYLIKLHMRDKGIYFNNPTTALLTGNTGVGKTFLAKTAAEIMSIPFIEINCKSISQEGWAGTSFKDLVINSIKEYQSNLPVLQRSITGGILLLDEFDKILKANTSSGGDNSNYHIQVGLLKYLEGYKLTDTPIQHSNIYTHGFKLEDISLNKFTILFAGAFTGLTTDIKSEIGFDKTPSKISMIDALIDFGMLPELAGRIQNHIKLKELTFDDFDGILQTEDFIYNKWLKALQYFNIDLSVNNNQDLIIRSLNRNLGVRGLIQEIEELVNNNINNNVELMDLEKLSIFYTGVKR